MPNLITEGGEGVEKQAKSDYVICERPQLSIEFNDKNRNIINNINKQFVPLITE